MDNEGINTTENKEFGFSKKKLLIFSLLFVILIGSICAVIIMLSKRQTAAPIITSNTYNDKGKYFTLQIPRSWNTTENIAQGTTGIGTPQEATQNIEEVQLGDTSGTVIAIQVYEVAPTCPFNQPLTTSFASLPASFDDNVNTWTIPTTKALIMVTISYPGSNTHYHNLQQSIPTPVPSSIAEQNRKHVMEI